MRKMADCGSSLVMLRYLKQIRNGSRILNEAAKSLYLIYRHLFFGSKDVVSIFQKRGVGIGIAVPFTSCHGMAADKTILQSQFAYLFMNRALYTAYIGEKSMFLQKRGKNFQSLQIYGYRGTEKKVVTPAKVTTN